MNFLRPKIEWLNERSVVADVFTFREVLEYKQKILT